MIVTATETAHTHPVSSHLRANPSRLNPAIYLRAISQSALGKPATRFQHSPYTKLFRIKDVYTCILTSLYSFWKDLACLWLWRHKFNSMSWVIRITKNVQMVTIVYPFAILVWYKDWPLGQEDQIKQVKFLLGHRQSRDRSRWSLRGRRKAQFGLRCFLRTTRRLASRGRLSLKRNNNTGCYSNATWTYFLYSSKALCYT